MTTMATSMANTLVVIGTDCIDSC